MSEFHFLPAVEERAEIAFRVYCEAAERAQASHDLADALAAGKAWAAFLAVFAPTYRQCEVAFFDPRACRRSERRSL